MLGLHRVGPRMTSRRFRVVARVSSVNPKAVGPVLEQVFAKGSVKESEGEYVINGELEGGTAKELNRSLLSALRRVEKKTRLRAEWTADDGTVERFFDYVLKKTTEMTPS